MIHEHEWADRDAEVARAMGIDVIGWSSVTPDHDSDYGWDISMGFRGVMHTKERVSEYQRPVYVEQCMCDMVDLNDETWQDFDPEVEKPHGHFAFCLAVVPKWYEVDELALRVLHHWRGTGHYCCINIKSDHDLVWDVSWSYTDDETHETYSVGVSEESLSQAICEAFIEAERRRKQ